MFLPLGFRFAGVHAGLKSNSALADMAMIVSDRPTVAAGVFTQNVVCGAPVTVARSRLPSDDLRVVVINTRVANTCTGEQGIIDAERMAARAAAACDLDERQAIAMSTGVIGRMLPMEKIDAGIVRLAADLGDDAAAFQRMAHGMMTTDLVPKFTSREVLLPSGARIRIAGVCKGSGMIAPKMATMLAVLATDAALDKETAQTMLCRVADATFNCVTVDGDTSTSDMLVLLANGAASDLTAPITAEDKSALEKALYEVSEELAKMIAADGEGATHLITVEVGGCVDIEAARKIARSIAQSPLVKTAIAGGDPNWGRIMCAAGYANVPFDPMKARLLLNGFELFRAGRPMPFTAAEISTAIRGSRETSIRLTLGEGEASARMWTCDFTREYIAINADYTS